MDTDPTSPIETGSDEDSLEGPSTVIEPTAAASATPSVAPETPVTPTPGTTISPAPDNEVPGSSKPSFGQRWRGLIGRVNIYLLAFIFVLIIAVTVVLVAYLDSKRSSSTDVSTQSLSESTLKQLANSDVNVGNANHVLNIQSSAVFAGKVLVRQDLEVAGNIQLGGTAALNDLAVSGTAQFGQAQVSKDLSVSGNTALQGTATVAKSLQVNGNGSFGGALTAPQITTSNLQLNGDLILTHHITAGGALPSRTNGSALGSGGTASVSGSDTSGSITINTGSGPAAGCFVTINFAARYNATPHVLVTPIGSSAASLPYYVNRGSTSFSICDVSTPPSNASFGFDYFVVN